MVNNPRLRAAPGVTDQHTAIKRRGIKYTSNQASGQGMAQMPAAAVGMALDDQDMSTMRRAHHASAAARSTRRIATEPLSSAASVKPSRRASACMRTFSASATPTISRRPRPSQ